MSNQHTSTKAVAAKERTTQALAQTAKVVSANQGIVSHSHSDKMFFSQRDTEAFNRLIEIDQMLEALSAEKADLEKCREVYRFASETLVPEGRSAVEMAS